MALTISNRAKFLLAGPLFEAVYPWWPGQPHLEVVARLREVRPARVLELCAGTAYLARLIARDDPAAIVDAIDLSEHMLYAGRRRLSGLEDRVRLHQGDVTALPFGDGTVDAVVVSFGLHELATCLRARAVAEGARVLRPGGRFVTVEVDRPVGAVGALVDAYLWAVEPRDARGVLGVGLARTLADHGLLIAHHRPAGGANPTQVVVADKPV